MSVQSLRAHGQHRNESALLVDSCTASRPGASGGPLDPETGLPVGGDDAVVWSGPCWLKMPSSASLANVAGDVVSVQRPTVALPLSAPRLMLGDVITITGSIVPLNVGIRCTVTGLPGGSFVTLARYEVEVTT